MKRLRIFSVALVTAGMALAILLAWQLAGFAQIPGEPAPPVAGGPPGLPPPDSLVTPVVPSGGTTAPPVTPDPNVPLPILPPEPKLPKIETPTSIFVDPPTSAAKPSATNSLPSVEGIYVKVFTIKHARAEELAPQIQKMYTKDVVADPRTNSVIVRGSNYSLGEVTDFIKLLDVPTPDKPSLQNSAATESHPGERAVTALVDGVVAEVLVKTGDDVKAGQALVKLKNSELEMRLKQQAADIAVADVRSKELQASYDSGNVTIYGLDDAKRNLTNLRLQHEQDREKLQLLTVTSPIDGKVVTPNLRERLIERPVSKGESLLVIGIKGTPSPTPVLQYGLNEYRQLPQPQQVPIPAPQPQTILVKPANTPYQKAEQKAGKLAEEYRGLHKQEPLTGTITVGVPGLSGDPGARNELKVDATYSDAKLESRDKKLEDLKAEIRCEVENAFKARQKSQQAELEALRKKLNQIETSIKNREQNREAIINRRVEELINPDVKWDAGAAASQPGNVLRANAPPQNFPIAAPLPVGATIRRVPVTTAREVETPDGKKMVYEESMREEVVYDGSLQPPSTAPANSLRYQQSPYTDLEAIQGEWKVESGMEGGKPAESLPAKFVITKEFLIAADGAKQEVATYTLDSSKNPGWIDFRAQQRLTKGIYKLSGDSLVMCLTKGDSAGKQVERPTVFESRPDSPNFNLVVLKRENSERQKTTQPYQSAIGDRSTTQSPNLAPVQNPPKADNVAIRRFPVFSTVETPGGKKLVAEVREEVVDENAKSASTFAAPPPAFRNAQEALQGKWKVLLAADEGEDRSGKNNNRFAKELKSCTFADNRMAFDLQDGSTEVATFKLNYDHNPCWIDIEVKGRVMKGIYELNDTDGTLKICYPENRKGRSTAFESEEDSVNDVLIVLQRDAGEPATSTPRR
jgi:uncharacterized protein (TIGR03067 family)